MQRALYDMTHQSSRVGMLGRLQCLTWLPVLPGDSWQLDMNGYIRLAALRREVVTDFQVDICGFFVPHRHVYGATWEQAMKEGYDTTATFTGYSISATDRDAYSLGVPDMGATFPKWLIEGPNRVWDQYFRIPHLPRDANYATWSTGTSDSATRDRQYGRLCARLDHPLNAATRVNGGATWQDLNSSDTDVAAVSTLDILDLARVQAEYKSEADNAWFSNRYREVLKRKWGTSVNIDADQRPEFLFRQTISLSGRDVDGTGDANLGQFTGKTVQRIQVDMPPKFFHEHGTLWVFMLVRPPLLHVHEVHPSANIEGTYESLFADPVQMAGKAPVGETWLRWLGGGGGSPSAEYLAPYGQEWRMRPNVIHPRFVANGQTGYPFLQTKDATGAAYYYHSPTEYDLIFQGLELGHWQSHKRVRAMVRRKVPEAATSIYAGT